MNLFITVKQAISLLPDGENIHTFRNPGGMLIGCDISRQSIIAKLNAAEKIEIAGDTAKSLKHAIAIIDDIGALFIESDMEKVNKIDPPVNG